jgi:uncharacterized Zn finger protein
MTYKIKANCPECGYEVDDASVVGGEENVRPSPDDLAICIRCAGCGFYVLADDGTLALRLPTIKEKVRLSQDEEVQRVREKIVEMSDVWFAQ